MKALIKTTAVAVALTVSAMTAVQAGGNQAYVDGCGYGHVVDVKQVGDYNYTSVVACGEAHVLRGKVFGKQATEIVHSFGFRNKDDTLLDGNYISRVLIQKGIWNKSVLRSHGHSNTHVCQQYGARNRCDVNANGDNITTYIRQTGGSKSRVNADGGNISISIQN